MEHQTDEVLLLLPDDLPSTYTSLPRHERHWRGRAFLMTWVVFRDEPYSWFAALADDERFIADMKSLIASTPDERVRHEVQAALRETGPWKPAIWWRPSEIDNSSGPGHSTGIPSD